MGRTFVTSDLHIGHNREFVWQARGFESIEEHDLALLTNWNRTVVPEDTVYILGDVMLRDIDHGIDVLKQLNGQLTILQGNHDSQDRIERYRECENVVRAGDAAMYLKYGGFHFYLSHYPTLVFHEKLKPMKTALINLYGHTHQTENFYNGHPYMYHVGMDSHHLTPADLDDVINEIQEMNGRFDHSKIWNVWEEICEKKS